jgi:hypothetical protein
MGARVIHQNPAHHLRGNPEEVRTILPGNPVVPGDPEKCLVHDRRRLQRVIAPFLPQVGGRAPLQVAVHERDEPVACAQISTRLGMQQRGYGGCAFAH